MEMDILTTGFMLEDKGLSHEEIDEYFAHHGVKGQKWGVRREGRKDLRETGKTARSIIKESRKATTQEGRNAAADRYKNEILKKMKSEEFKKSWDSATTVTKGTIAAHTLAYGIFAPVTIRQMKDMNKFGLDREVATAQQILKEMRTP